MQCEYLDQGQVIQIIGSDNGSKIDPSIFEPLSDNIFDQSHESIPFQIRE